MGKKSKNKTKCERRHTVSDTTPASASEELVLLSAVPAPPPSCTHGAPTDWSSIPYMPTFLDHLEYESFDRLLSKMAAEMRSVYFQVEERRLFLAGLTAVGTVLLLRDCPKNPRKWIKPAMHAATIMSLVDIWPLNTLHVSSETLAEMKLKSEQTGHNIDSFKLLVGFFRERIPCNCLELCYKDQLKDCTGCCRKCGESYQDKDLLDCTGCFMVKYCSPVCQRAHWSDHKKICTKQHKKHSKNNGAPTTTA